MQRDLQSDINSAAALSDFPRLIDLLNGLNDADLGTRVRQLSPEILRGLQEAAPKAAAPRVTQAVQAARIQSGTQTENVEGNVYNTPVTLFSSGVIISKHMRFVKAGNFRNNDDFVRLKNRIMEAIRTHLTNRFKLKVETPGVTSPAAGDGEFPIRTQAIDDQSASYSMILHGQAHGRGAVAPTSGNIFELGQPNETETPDEYLAHECAHVLLGAHDEYAEKGMPASRQVFTDNSLMGDFYSEGIAKAELKPRHFGALVRLVSKWFPGRNVSIIP